MFLPHPMSINGANYTSVYQRGSWQMKCNRSKHFGNILKVCCYCSSHSFEAEGACCSSNSLTIPEAQRYKYSPFYTKTCNAINKRSILRKSFLLNVIAPISPIGIEVASCAHSLKHLKGGSTDLWHGNTCQLVMFTCKKCTILLHILYVSKLYHGSTKNQHYICTFYL